MGEIEIRVYCFTPDRKGLLNFMLEFAFVMFLYYVFV